MRRGDTKMQRWFMVLALLALAPLAQAEQVLRQYSGDRSKATPEFEVEAPWLIDWRVNSDYPNSMGVSADLVEARTGQHMGRVFSTKAPGDGVRLVSESGRYYFKVDSTVAYWTIKVIALTREEAEQYAPKGQAEEP